jgi:HTH-type transcriptional regulator/antitoxin HigA
LRTLREIERLWGAGEGTVKGDRLDVLTTLVDAYEQKHCPIDPPDPIEAIRVRLEQQGLDARAPIGVIGGRSRVYEVMERKRPLSLEMIRRLHQRFGIAAEALIRPSRLRAASPKAGIIERAGLADGHPQVCASSVIERMRDHE